MDGWTEGRMDLWTKVQMNRCMDGQTDGYTVSLILIFFASFGVRRGVAATPWLLWRALKIEVCFSTMKISHNPVEGGWGPLKKSLSRPSEYRLEGWVSSTMHHAMLSRITIGARGAAAPGLAPRGASRLWMRP